MPDKPPALNVLGDRIITLERHILDHQREVPGATGAFSQLLSSIALAAKVITREVRRAGLIDILGLTGDTNVQGEKVTKLDDYAHNLMVRMLARSGQVCGMASEEADGFIGVDQHPEAHYLVAFDPLDGSSNIDANASIGTIFGIWRREVAGGPATAADLMQPGTRLVGAGYVVYGSSTIFVYATGDGVHGFTLDPSIGEFLLSHRDIHIPERGKIYSVNEGNTETWTDGVRQYVQYLKSRQNQLGRPYSSRYIGSLVADFHRSLVYGGVFMYPASRDKPGGKLRLLFEAAPLAYICEHAGGAASDGTGRILEVAPDKLHQRVPLYIGSRLDVEEAVGFVSGRHRPAIPRDRKRSAPVADDAPRA